MRLCYIDCICSVTNTTTVYFNSTLQSITMSADKFLLLFDECVAPVQISKHFSLPQFL